MHKLLSVLALLAFTLAGCSDAKKTDDREEVVCPDGAAPVANANADEAPTCPVAPSVTLAGLPAQLGAYRSAAFTWTVDNGSVPQGHSMLSSLRWSPTPVPDNELTAMDKYPSELAKREHQAVPAKFEGKLSFTKAGTVYVRAYSQIQGEGFNRTDFWSDEVAIAILPVQPTGTVLDLTHAPGDFLGDLTLEANLALGDAVRLVNDDLLAHTLNWKSGPVDPGAITAPGRGAGEPVAFTVPGVYEFLSDDQQSRTVTIRVAAPA